MAALTRRWDLPRLVAMHALAKEEFTAIIRAVLTRFLAQNGLTASPADLAAIAARLHAVVGERGLSRPLAPDERGAPGGMPEAECASLVARVMSGGPAAPLLTDAVRQLVKACFYPEFKDCRDSFRETSADGVCRRQQLERVRTRVSGTHCVDCPHWMELAPELHQEFLAREWRGDAETLRMHRAIFLPEDFRALRQWLHTARRSHRGL